MPFSLVRCQFSACHYGTFCSYVDPVCNFLVTYLFLRMFPFCEEVLSAPVWCIPLWRVSLSCVFFLSVSYCLLHIFIKLINVSSALHHNELVYRRCFCGWSIIFLITYITLSPDLRSCRLRECLFRTISYVKIKEK